jgi:hypothetical protein
MKIKGVRLILHPGMPKCGSSSIQASLISNLKVLKENNIFILDKKLRVRDSVNKSDPHGIPYSIIFECIEGEKDLRSELIECCNFIKEKHGIEEFDLVLSSETLSFICTSRGYEFHKTLSSLFDDCVVLIAIRAPWNQLFSHWRQSDYRKGLTFIQYVDRYFKQSGKSGEYWESRVERFLTLYNDVKIISLDTSNDLVNDFYNSFNDDSLGIKQVTKNSNRSLSPIFCEIMAKYPKAFCDEVNDVRNTIKRHKNILDSIIPSDSNNSLIFSNDLLPEHIELIDKLKCIFIDKYLLLLERFGTTTQNKRIELERILSEKKEVETSMINDSSELMLVELVSNLKRI